MIKYFAPILQRLNEDWLLDINLKKTKVVVFQNSLENLTSINVVFALITTKSTFVSNYTYLSVNSSTNCSFTANKINLNDRTRRSTFGARRYLEFSKLPIALIAEYLSSFLFSHVVQKFGELWQKLFQLLARRYCCKDAYLLLWGSWVGEGDLGRLSSRKQIEFNISQFWLNLEQFRGNKIAKQCFN